jgi:hypothetical protein
MTMRITRHLLCAALLLGGCSDTPDDTATPQARGSQPNQRPSGPTCPTTDTLIPVAVATPVVSGQVTVIADIHCSLPWAAAQVDIRDGATDEDGEPMANTYVQIFRLGRTGWTAVDRDEACAGTEIPARLKGWACMAS